MEQDKITQEQKVKIDPKQVEKMKKAKEKAVKTNQIVTKNEGSNS